ncbi:MAG: phosphodiester glycosidase family protein [Phycisphaerae bacterium]|nr:phosphodiester glycosidase family protein [Phycisphaerae bacterium]
MKTFFRLCLLTLLAIPLPACGGPASLELSGVPATVSADEAPSRADLPFAIISETRDDPPMRLWIVRIDLTHPRAQVRVVPAGDDPDGPGPWQTTLAPVSSIASRERFDLAVNASFFSVDKTGPWAEGGYKVDQPAAAMGWTMTDSRLWSRSREDWPVLWIDAHNRAHITDTRAISPDARQMVAGNAWILRNGQDRVPTEGMMTVRHPRTAVGIDAEGKTLTILIVDGRQPGVSVGMTGAEMLLEFQKHGVVNAINLDGGGSTTLVRREVQSGEFQIVNRPSDGKERPVANVLGVGRSGG